MASPSLCSGSDLGGCSCPCKPSFGLQHPARFQRRLAFSAPSTDPATHLYHALAGKGCRLEGWFPPFAPRPAAAPRGPRVFYRGPAASVLRRLVDSFHKGTVRLHRKACLFVALLSLSVLFSPVPVQLWRSKISHIYYITEIPGRLGGWLERLQGDE